MAQHRPKQRARGTTAPVRLLDRRGASEPLLVATQTPPQSQKSKNPTPRRGSSAKLYRPKRDDGGRKTPPAAPEPPRPLVEDAQVLVQRLDTWEKGLKTLRFVTTS
jgi:hypothetical protein